MADSNRPRSAKKHVAQFKRLCERVNATFSKSPSLAISQAMRLWNWADHKMECELYFHLLTYYCDWTGPNADRAADNATAADNAPAAAADTVRDKSETDRLQQFARLCVTAARNHYTNNYRALHQAARLWNLADHQRDSEAYWELLQIACPWFFTTSSPNSARLRSPVGQWSDTVRESDAEYTVRDSYKSDRD